jgi:hypothetical protein
MTDESATLRRQPWEYRSCSKQSETYLLQELNEAGKEGWELVAANFSKDLKGNLVWTAILKRPLETTARQGAAAPAAKSSAAPAAKSSAAPASAAKPPAKGESQGFDLSGDEFGFKKE